MFQPSSRYYSLKTATYVTSEGREIRYKRRRFIPNLDSALTLAEVQVNQGDRLDLIAANLLGDGEQFWRVCDANAAMNPDDLTEPPGRRLRIVLPEA